MNLPAGETAGARNGRYVPPVPYITKVEAMSLGDIPSECYGCCAWSYETGRWRLKYPNGFCPFHGSLTRGLDL